MTLVTLDSTSYTQKKKEREHMSDIQNPESSVTSVTSVTESGCHACDCSTRSAAPKATTASDIAPAVAVGSATCSSCALYQAPRSSEWGASGVCRRYAPVLVTHGPAEEMWAEAVQPYVSASDVCGEWISLPSSADSAAR